MQPSCSLYMRASRYRDSATISRSDVIQTRSRVGHQVESITYFANSDLRFQSDAKFDTENASFK